MKKIFLIIVAVSLNNNFYSAMSVQALDTNNGLEDQGSQLAKAFKMLGVFPNSSLHELNRAYRTQALACHPDKHFGEDATAQFQQLQQAHELIKWYFALVEQLPTQQKQVRQAYQACIDGVKQREDKIGSFCNTPERFYDRCLLNGLRVHMLQEQTKMMREQAALNELIAQRGLNSFAKIETLLDAHRYCFQGLLFSDLGFSVQYLEQLQRAELEEQEILSLFELQKEQDLLINKYMNQRMNSLVKQGAIATGVMGIAVIAIKAQSLFGMPLLALSANAACNLPPHIGFGQ